MSDTLVTTQQISDVHACIVERTGVGMDPAIVRGALEAAGFVWDWADQDIWWDEIRDAMDTYTNALREYDEAGRADRERFLGSRVEEARRDVIDRFYWKGWVK